MYPIYCGSLTKHVKGCCFALAVLVAKSYLRINDPVCGKVAREIRRDFSTPLDSLIDVQEVRDFYAKANIPEGPVRLSQMGDFYEAYLKEENIDLVVFSKKFKDKIVYDSRYDPDLNGVMRLTNDVIFLWLNDNHCDVVLSAKTFSQHSLKTFCFRCMKYRTHFETVDTHVCKAATTCLKCYRTNENCADEVDVKYECSNCQLIFYNRSCFQAHMFNRVFHSNMTANRPDVRKITPCNFMFFCKTCYKIVPRFFFRQKGRFKETRLYA